MEIIENRNFLIITPRQPFIDWVNNYDDSTVDQEQFQGVKTLYLVSPLDYTTEKDITGLVKQHYREIFLQELFSWYTDEDYFPKKLTYKTFSEWFNYEYTDTGFDLLAGSIKKEEY